MVLLKENDLVELEHLITKKRKVITVRWYDSKTGILSLPDYEYHRLEENAEYGWTPEWKVTQKLKQHRRKRQQKKGNKTEGS